jgi:hypothetical protein
MFLTIASAAHTRELFQFSMGTFSMIDQYRFITEKRCRMSRASIGETTRNSFSIPKTLATEVLCIGHKCGTLHKSTHLHVKSSKSKDCLLGKSWLISSD